MSSPEPQPVRLPRRGATASIAWRIVLRLLLAVALSFGTLMLLVFALSFLNEPSTLAVIRAESEKTRFTVANAQQATFPIGGMRVFGEGDFDGRCAEEALGKGWALEPQLGAEMTYTVLGDGRLLIELAGFEDGRESAILRGVGPDGRMAALSAQYDVHLRDDAECGERVAHRLPIWGPGEIGGVPTFRGDGPSATLLRGSLEMYGRAARYDFDVLGLVGLVDADAERVVTGDDRSLYASLTSAFQIPPGSRVTTLLADADDSLKALRGFAIQEGRALRVDASTESPEVYFYPPGAGKQPDLLKMSLLSQIGNDPNLQRIFQIIVWFVVVLPIAIELIRPLFGRQGEDW